MRIANIWLDRISAIPMLILGSANVEPRIVTTNNTVCEELLQISDSSRSSNQFALF